MAEVMHRLFVALRPPAEAVEQIRRHRAAVQPATPVRDDRLHLTLFLAADFEQLLGALAVARRMASTLDGLAANAFGFALKRFGFGGSSLEVGAGQELRHLQTQIAERMARARIAMRPGKTFSPHVTLGYDCRAPRRGDIEPIAWRATEVGLIHSLLGRTEHRVLGTWPLVEQPRLL